jgi:hypothetical protein
MTKNTTTYIHERHTKTIKNGTLEFRKEDVKQDRSVAEFGLSQVDFIDAFQVNNQTTSSGSYYDKSTGSPNDNNNNNTSPAVRSRNLRRLSPGRGLEDIRHSW